VHWPSGIGPELRAQAKTVKLKEKWCEAEVNRIAGEIALISPAPDATKAEAYFERALAVARVPPAPGAASSRREADRGEPRSGAPDQQHSPLGAPLPRLSSPSVPLNLAFVHLVMVSSV